jgi:3-oxoacyl-[acyl-carrier-protein] synthase II
LSFTDGRVPATLNCERPDPDCPVEVVRGRPLASSARTALVVNWTSIGQAAAVVLAGAD